MHVCMSEMLCCSLTANVCKQIVNLLLGMLTLQALKLSMVIGDCAGIRTALRVVQTNKYGKTKAISAHCPTR